MGRVPIECNCAGHPLTLSLVFCRNRGLSLCAFIFLLSWDGASLSTCRRALPCQRLCWMWGRIFWSGMVLAAMSRVPDKRRMYNTCALFVVVV